MEVMDDLLNSYPDIKSCKDDILKAFNLLKESYQTGGKVLVCGNGGSAADSEHIVGELMKGFMYKRPVAKEYEDLLTQEFGVEGDYLARNLQGALPAISLVSPSALMTAFSNDMAADMVFAQQVFGLGNEGDVLIAISTSGNSKNVVNAVKIAKSIGVKTVCLSGNDGGELKNLCDASIVIPKESTPEIQERHLPVYHALCIMLEQEFFKQ